MGGGKFAVILPAAGRSTRFGDPTQKKIFAELDGRPVWLRAVEPFVARADVARVILAIASEDRELFERRYRPNVAFLNLKVIDGGAERADSIALALEAIDVDCEFVAVHDAARPCIPPELIEAVFVAARAHSAAVPGVPVADTLKRIGEDRTIVETVPRAGLFAVQTPQAFRLDLLTRAYANRAQVENPTDCARLVEALGVPCRIIDSSPFNLKITTADDLLLASAILKTLPEPKRDVPTHPFADERAMWGEKPKGSFDELF